MTIASIVINHKRRQVGIRASGAVHWLPPSFFEPVLRLETKYAGMDSAMRHWEALMRQAADAARDA